MPDALLAPTFLFRFSTRCIHRKSLWTKRGPQLGEDFRLPSFGQLEGRPVFGDLRAAWNEDGLVFALRVEGKKQTPWCRESRLDDSDGLQLFIDTRDTHNIHRASRFCHRFIFLPSGGGKRGEEPVAKLLTINRARENPRSVDDGFLQVRSEKRVNGYLLQARIPAKALTGFDPDESPRLGFSYAVVDRELGWQVYSVGPEFPFMEDPSLWGTLELARTLEESHDFRRV